MDSTTEHNALLLQVMAHDLLAPLTAVKWQLELVRRDGVSNTKREEYFSGLHASTELGITLTKHAHVAGRVLTGTYTSAESVRSISICVASSVTALAPQYERHGVTLTASFDDDPVLRQFDHELVGTLLWSVAKFFLSCAPPNSAVAVQGMCVSRDDSSLMYVVVFTATEVPDAEACVRSFEQREARGAYDQGVVFARLSHEVSLILESQVHLTQGGSGMIAEIQFSLKDPVA